jgi:hypothetical protein
VVEVVPAARHIALAFPQLVVAVGGEKREGSSAVEGADGRAALLFLVGDCKMNDTCQFRVSKQSWIR